MTIGDLLELLDKNKQVIGLLVTGLVGAFFGKKKVDQVVAKAKARIEDLREQAYAIIDGLVEDLIEADKLTAETVEALTGQFRAPFMAIVDTLNLDVTPEQIAQIVQEVRDRAIKAINTYTKHRLPPKETSEAMHRKWDHLLYEVSPKYHARLKELDAETKRKRAAKQEKELRAANKVAAKRLKGG